MQANSYLVRVKREKIATSPALAWTGHRIATACAAKSNTSAKPVQFVPGLNLFGFDFAAAQNDTHTSVMANTWPMHTRGPA
eukprot:884407-Rhodomonas_salina.2